MAVNFFSAGRVRKCFHINVISFFLRYLNLFFWYFLKHFFIFFEFIFSICFWFIFWIFSIFFGIFFSFSCFWFVYVAFICPWSAHDQPVIYRASPAKSAKKFVLVNFFRFSKSREKSQKTQRKSGFLCHFLLIKTAFFLKRSSQKCIIKTIISYTTNAQLFHWKTVRKCLRTNVIHLFF